MTSDEVIHDALDLELAGATAAGRVLVARCADGGHVFWHPRGHCPQCGSRNISLVSPAGPARVYTATTNRRPRGGKGAEPVQVGYVEFADGLRMLANLRFPDGPPVIGAEVTPEREGDGDTARLVFRPVL
ncbi:OB-fold domain-containing protein [soil metagenome]